VLNKPINHVLIIPDGNRRWAKENGKTLEETYEYALSTVTTKLIDFFLAENNANILSIYIISRRNMKNRDKHHVKPILENEKKVFEEWKNNEKFKKAKIKFKFIGDLKLFPKDYLQIATELERPSKNRRIVNISKIDKLSKPGEIILVPGKVLSSGELTHNITISAYAFSDSAKSKILVTGKVISLEELMKQNPKGKGIRILG